ncbi:hypothetical protein IE81DRAFT_349713 [Ceraceosorus guamensis]|uniref:Uncharacterized protein n=1 Tax=Ceraceosorus guamensis TaxID=1522189 RepID=A0A316VQR6_9BASI|nr:hypothetical protein IE81DRAFT_349713 [Ceraceosorus guamensis]PWN39936.1 hypothetical protein IE81DRAFT_349713 [Ceraceosorus guamensis]
MRFIVIFFATGSLLAGPGLPNFAHAAPLKGCLGCIEGTSSRFSEAAQHGSHERVGVGVTNMHHDYLSSSDIHRTYADPNEDPLMLYGHPAFQRQPNHGEADAQLHGGSLVSGPSLVSGSGRHREVRAHFATPGTEWKYKGTYLKQKKGPSVGMRLPVSKDDLFYDATHGGGVVGKIHLPRGMKNQKGLYDITRNNVPAYGTAMRPNRDQALDAMRDMRNARPSPSWHAPHQ